MDGQLWFLLLIAYSVRAHFIDNDPFPMHTAAIKGDLNLVKHLLEGGAPINQQNTNWFYTPLHYAAYYGREDVVHYLLASGASKTIGDHEGGTALDVSYFRECDAGYNENPYCKEAPVNYEGTVRLLTAECVSSIMCESDLSCVNQKCVNLCHGYCGVNTDCNIVSRLPICSCKFGYSGNAKTGCQLPVACFPKCLNGECIGPNKCQCQQGWTGNSCQISVCSPRCLNGKCIGPNICQCQQGWTGNLCQFQNKENKPLCYIPSETDTNVIILKCGTAERFDFDVYRTVQHHRQGSNCAINNQVPLDSRVMVSCWRSPPIIANCNQQSSWDVCDANSCRRPLTTLIHLCKQEAMNAQYCGYRPPYTSAVSQLYIHNAETRYPWLVGIFVKEKYVCTGTLISIRYVLTAAHCTSGSQSSSDPIDLRDVKIQHIAVDEILKRRIDKIIHHPLFKNGARPVNDISLLRLEIPVIFSASVMPSCIGEQFQAQIESAVVFDRSSEANYHWQVQVQQVDNRCSTFGSGESCQQLKIEDRQFCSTQLIPGISLAVRKGASGGPFLVNTGTEEQEKQSLLGVASYRVQMDACRDSYTVYTDVTAFSFWIEMCLDAPLDAKQDCNGYGGF